MRSHARATSVPGPRMAVPSQCGTAAQRMVKGLRVTAVWAPAGKAHKGIGVVLGLATRFIGGRGTSASQRDRARRRGTYRSDWGRKEAALWRGDAEQDARQCRCCRSGAGLAKLRRRRRWSSSRSSSSPLRVLLFFSLLLCFSGGGGRKGKFPWLGFGSGQLGAFIGAPGLGLVLHGGTDAEG